MKYAVILPDGASDEALPELGGQTPLEAARIPHMDEIARAGRLGLAVTIPPGYTAGTDVGTLTLMGYDPDRYYSGRAPLEAAAKGLSVRPDQLIFRCNFVTIADGRMADFTAGHIPQPDADRLVAALNDALKSEGCEFYAGVSYRNLMLLSDAAHLKLTCAPPHDIPDQPVATNLPRGEGVDRVLRIMDLAAKVIADHPVRAARLASGHAAPTNIWLWGQGRPTHLETLADRFGVSGACITAVDIIRGMAVLMGLKLIPVQGATGYIDTNYQGKGEAAVKALEEHDLVVVHVEAADEAGHLGNAREKVKALERIDELVVGPVLKALRKHKDWRILVAADHPTPCSTKAHSSVPPLFAYAGSDVPAGGLGPFTEKAAASGVFLDPGHPLLSMFLGR